MIRTKVTGWCVVCDYRDEAPSSDATRVDRATEKHTKTMGHPTHFTTEPVKEDK